MKCEICFHYGLYQMISSGKPYGYSGDIPCLRCKNYFMPSDEYKQKEYSAPLTLDKVELPEEMPVSNSDDTLYRVLAKKINKIIKYLNQKETQ